MKKSLLFKKFPKGFVQCQLCNHFCKIAEGQTGLCGVRKNIDGNLYSLVYDKIAACHTDPVEKKPLYHFLPGTSSFSIATVGCNFSCLNCQNWELSQASKPQAKKIYGERVTPEEIVQKAQINNCPSISYTYTEPTIFFELAFETAKIARKKGLKNIFVSNGFMSSKMIGMIAPYLDAINIDLKFFSEDLYRKVCGGKLQPVLDNIVDFNKRGIEIEVTTLVIPGYSDDERQLKKIAEFLAFVNPKIPWHLSRFHPMYKLKDVAYTPAETLKKAYQIGKKAGLGFVYVWAPPHDFGEELFSIGETYCPKCQKLVISRSGWQPNLIGIKEKKGRGFCQNCGGDLYLWLK